MYQYFHFCLILFGFLYVLKLYFQRVVRNEVHEEGYLDEHELTEQEESSGTEMKMDCNHVTNAININRVDTDAKKRMSRYNSLMYL